MPKSYDINIDPFLNELTPKMQALWKKEKENYIITKLFGFLVQKVGKTPYLEEKSKKEYYSLVTRIWASYTKRQINSPEIDGLTMLMHALGLTKDPVIILFAIENTSSKGVSVRCPSEVRSENYALAAACAQELHECLEPLIAKSTGDSLKAGMDYLEVVYRSKTFRSLTFNGDGSIGKSYTLDEISHLMKLIKERQAQLQWGIVPVIGPLVRGLLYPKTTKTKAAPTKASSLTAPVQPGMADTSFTYHPETVPTVRH